MSSKQILFRLESDTAKLLETKLKEKGISKQFLFNKVVELFLEDKLSFDSDEIAIDSSKIAFDKIEVVETIKKHCLNDLATLIANDNNLIALVVEKLQPQLIAIDNTKIASDSNEIAIDNNGEALSENQDDLEVVTENKIPSESIKSITNDDEKIIEIKNHDAAISLIKKLHQQGKKYTEIARVLTDKYFTAKGKTKWEGNQVSRIIRQFS